MAEGGSLFEGISFAVIPSNALRSSYPTDLGEAIESRGGRRAHVRPGDLRVENLDDVTHIISAHIDFPQYNEAVERGIHVVKPSWVGQSLMRGKLAGSRQHSPDPSQYFQDVIVTCAELPEGDADAIQAGVLALGGQYSSPLTKLVTHIVTLSLDHNKCDIAREKKVNCKIVLPAWFDDCLRLGKKINEKPYMFPNPLYLQRTGARPAHSHSPYLDGAIAAMPDGLPKAALLDTPPSSPSEARKNLSAFTGRQIKLSSDLGLGRHLRETVERLVTHGGGTVVGDVAEADLYIGRYREGADYVTASRAGKEVANLSWLYHVINHNRYTNPLSKLLHYPVPRNGIPGFKDMRVSISNYSGDARVYLENLITHCGAEYTRTMKQDNTHLITAHTHSEKCEAAQEWNINLVNHLWVEESYAKCAVQTLTNPRYTMFPAKTHLGEICGQTSLDIKRLEQVYFPKPRPSLQQPIRLPEAQDKTELLPQKAGPALGAAAAECTAQNAPQFAARPQIAEDPKTEEEEGKEDKEKNEPEPEPEPESELAKKSNGRRRESLTATPRLVDDEKENESPLTMSSGRASKVKALTSMHQQADDIALFQREMKRKGGVTHGGRRSSRAEDFSSPVPAPKDRKKRKSEEATYEVTAVGSDLSDSETQSKPLKAAKKAKHGLPFSDLPPVQYRMMVTGDERWIGKPKEEDAAKTKLRQLGVQLTQDTSNVDILVAPRILRTRKFVAALASAPLVVDTKFLDTALEQNKLMNHPPMLQDQETEERLGFQLKDAIERARINQRKLFRGWSIFVTKDVGGGFDTYKDIITLNGGEAHMYAGRTGLALPKRRLRDDPNAGSESQHQGGDEEYDYVYLVSGTSQPEIKLWKAFRNLAEKQDLKMRVVKTDWLLNAAMSQEIRYDEDWALG